MVQELGEPPRVRELTKLLRQAIQRGEWSVGAPLSTTRQLANKHRVSLATVRAVLQRLERQGLIERRPRRGSIIKARTPSSEGVQSMRQIAIVSAASTKEHGLEESWTERVNRATEAAVWEHDLQPTPLPCDPSRPDMAEELFARMEGVGAKLVGVIVFNHPSLHSLPAMLDEIGMPWVTVNRMTSDQSHNFVAADNVVGCRLLGESLALAGHRRILALAGAGVSVSEAESEKLTGLIQGFLRAEAPINGIDYITCGYERPAGDFVRQYLNDRDKPDVIFALNDSMASSAITACLEAGLSVPEQVKVVGGGGLELARHTRPRLTVISQPMETMGREASEMILEMIGRDTRRMIGRRICGHLVVRESLPIPQPLLRRLEQNYPEMIKQDPSPTSPGSRA